MSKDTSSRLSGILAVGDERTRRVVLIGSNQALLESERILKILDVPSRAESFHVYRLKNADAKVVAEQMNSILATAAKLSPDPKGAIPSWLSRTFRQTALSSLPHMNSSVRSRKYWSSSTYSQSRCCCAA